MKHSNQLHNIGVAAYERSFGLQYIDEDQIDDSLPVGSAIRVLLPRAKQGLRSDLSGSSVALVGNGELSGCGQAIDSHDIVIRISSMRHWKKSATDDGKRLTLWAGNPWFVVYSHEGHIFAQPSFEQHVLTGGEIWGVSPFHISLDSYRWLVEKNAYERFIVAPPPLLLYDTFCRSLDEESIRLLYAQTGPNRNLIGLPNFEKLLTGTRILLLLELCGVENISLFGFNLFSRGSDNIWFGHDVNVDLKVMLGVKDRFEKQSKGFYWHKHDKLTSISPHV